MAQPRYTKEEIVRRGRELYEKEIRARVEEGNKGKFLVIDVDTGEYEMDSDEAAAFFRAIHKNPDGLVYILRIGYPVAHQIGGHIEAAR